MIDKIKNILVGNLVLYHLVNIKDIDIYKFGIECYILKLIHYFTYCFVAIICGCFIEFLVFIISYTILRKYVGGIHASTRTGCLIISNVVLLIILGGGQRIQNGIPLQLLSMISLFIIALMAPVENPNRKLTQEESKKFKKNAICVCLVELIIASCLGSFCKWIHLGIIVGTIMAVLGKIRYSNCFCMK